MKPTSSLILAIAVFAAPVGAQDPAQPKPSFEVASIKPNNSGSGNSSTSTGSSRFIGTNVTLKQLIQVAFSAQNFQIIGGPGWINTNKYDVEARAEAGVAFFPQPPEPNRPSTLSLMLQSMLEDRFQLRIHRETRELPVYTLNIGKDGPKLKLSADQNPQRGGEPQRGAAAAAPPPAPGRGGSSSLAPGNVSTNVNRTSAETNANTVQIGRLVEVLARQLGRPVIDKTDLRGFYDIHLEWAPDPGATAPAVPNPPTLADPSGPTLFTALQEQLGLRLESTKGPVDVFVIDSVQLPSEN